MPQLHNNTPTINVQIIKPRAEIDIVNTIEYVMKSCQVKMAIVKYTKVRVKGLKFDRSQKDMLVWTTSI